METKQKGYLAYDPTTGEKIMVEDVFPEPENKCLFCGSSRADVEVEDEHTTEFKKVCWDCAKKLGALK